MTQIYRTIRHDNAHWDLEQFFQTDEFIGWAVIKCNRKEDDMNGYTKSISLGTKLQNLASQIPQQYRARVIAEATQDNPHDMERHLSALVISRRWEAMQIEDEAAEILEWLGDAYDISERIAQEARDFAEFCADVDAAMADDADLHATQDNARF